MPELCELHLASRFINGVSTGKFYRAPVIKSDVSKMTDIEWKSSKFTVQSTARGKELQMVLTDVSDDSPTVAKDESQRKLTLTFGFGMSGKFTFDRFEQIPKHAHLQFYTTETPANVLSFVDYRRFGKWAVRDFDFTRGPDPVLTPKEFRHNVLTSLDKSIFKKAICEAIMDQKYFNGIGNYLRAEIIFRTKIPPFTQARSVLQDLPLEHEIDEANPDILDLCTIVPKEVFGFSKPAEGYRPDSYLDMYKPFENWLRCYMKAGMSNLVDAQSRTMWFSGPAGPMVPGKKLTRHGGKKRKAVIAGEKVGGDDDAEEEDEGEVAAGSPKKARPSSSGTTKSSKATAVEDLYAAVEEPKKGARKTRAKVVKEEEDVGHALDSKDAKKTGKSRGASKPVPEPAPVKKAAEKSKNPRNGPAKTPKEKKDIGVSDPTPVATKSTSAAVEDKSHTARKKSTTASKKESGQTLGQTNTVTQSGDSVVLRRSTRNKPVKP